jgi:phosphate transport system permease protein
MASALTASERQAQKTRERIIEFMLLVAAASSVFVTLAIVFVLVYESAGFFLTVPLSDFLFGTVWSPLFANPQYGILPLLGGTLLSTVVALIFVGPIGLATAIYLSEFASSGTRETIKPILEILSGVPTVVYGFFALLFVTPALQTFVPGLPGFNILSAGIVIGIMIIPYVASLSEDALRAVPQTLHPSGDGCESGSARGNVRRRGGFHPRHVAGCG